MKNAFQGNLHSCTSSKCNGNIVYLLIFSLFVKAMAKNAKIRRFDRLLSTKSVRRD
jgi:hypothetical protein